MLALTKCSRSAQDQGAGERLGDPLRDPGRAALVVDVLGEHRELVAAEAGDGVARPQGLLDTRGDGGEQLVAGRVPEAVVDELELVEVEEEHGDRDPATGRHRQGVLQAVEEEAAVRESGEGIVQRFMLGPLLGPATLDRVREHVRDRLHEVDVLLAEPVLLGRGRAEHSVGLLVPLDQDDRGAPHVLLRLQLGLLEARLLLPIVDHRGGVRGERVAGLVAIVRRDPRLADELLRHADRGDEQKLVRLREELEDAAVVDVEDVGQDPARLAGELLDVRALQRVLTEPGDLALLMGLKPARLLAASEGARSLSERAPLPKLIAGLPGGEHRDAGADEEAEPREGEAAADGQGEDESRSDGSSRRRARSSGSDRRGRRRGTAAPAASCRRCSSHRPAAARVPISTRSAIDQAAKKRSRYGPLTIRSRGMALISGALVSPSPIMVRISARFGWSHVSSA